SYRPIFNWFTANRPWSSAVTTRVSPVSLLVTVILAFGTRAPAGSVTTPTTSPVLNAAKRPPASTTLANKIRDSAHPSNTVMSPSSHPHPKTILQQITPGMPHERRRKTKKLQCTPPAGHAENAPLRQGSGVLVQDRGRQTLHPAQGPPAAAGPRRCVAF